MNREAVPAQAPPLPGPVLSRQEWRDLAFVHWAVDPAVVAPMLPAGTRPDVFAGSTYVGLVPFTMGSIAVGAGPVLPWLGHFLETNVRLYSVDDAGRHGVVFRSLEASRLLTVLAARWGYRVPYAWSRMRVSPPAATGAAVPGTRTWTSRRRWPDRGLASRITVAVGQPVAPSALDVFLTARWGMHSRLAGRTLWTPNRHDTWPMYAAELVDLDDQLVAAAGCAVSGPPTVPVRWTPGVRTDFGQPHPI